jgi:7-keto-8-aminopelargonate synthetase-like enzyme
MQAELAERMSYARTRLAEKGVTMTTNDATPIFMIQFDSAPEVATTVRRLRERGFYCCVSTFPAVPVNKPSIRFTVSRHNSFDDIEALIEELSGAVEWRHEMASTPEATPAMF